MPVSLTYLTAVMFFPCPACDERVEGAVACSGRFDYDRDGELTTWSYDLCVCPTCGMGRLNRIPTAETLREFYTSTYDAYLEPTDEILTTPLRRAKMWEAAEVAKRYFHWAINTGEGDYIAAQFSP